MLFKSLSYGCIDTVVLFANSPHYSMTKNGETAGSNAKTNIDSSRYDDYVNYFLDITEYFLSKGVPVKYISPMNEPQWDWGGSWVGQEGCHYEQSDIVALSERFARGIESRGLPVKLMVPESGNIGKTTRGYLNALQSNGIVARNVGSYAYHSYGDDNNIENKINLGTWRKDSFPYANLDMTEWCELPCDHTVDDVGAAVRMARVIANDMSLSYANSWTSWVAVNSTGYNKGKKYSDALFYVENGDYSNPKKNVRYYGFAHFSKFVPAGSVLLETSTNYNNPKQTTSGYYYETNFAAFRTPEGKTVLVIVNENKNRTIDISMSGNNMKVYTTDGSHRLDKTYDGGKLGKISVAKNSITTIVCS